MINYILLVSRQGTTVYPNLFTSPLSRTRSKKFTSQRKSQVAKMVHDDVSKGQSQDRQGRHPARARQADEDV